VQPPLVVFVPGFMQHGEAWAPVAGRVAERYPTLCLDFTTHTLEERLAELRAAAPRGSTVVGYSMGGRLALQLAAREPDRIGALVTVGASPGIEDPAERARRRQADDELADWIEASGIEDVVDRWERQPIFSTQPEELVAAQRPGRLAHRPNDLARLLRSAGQGATEPVWHALPALETPLLAMAGENDERYVAAAARLAELAPHGRSVTIEGAGHAAQLERPERVAAAIEEFLS
jgi:2-succinyl-6-hydroxy-2,4-cyclohexadiene-1-carboxylate synthase